MVPNSCLFLGPNQLPWENKCPYFPILVLKCSKHMFGLSLCKRPLGSRFPTRRPQTSQARARASQYHNARRISFVFPGYEGDRCCISSVSSNLVEFHITQCFKRVYLGSQLQECKRQWWQWGLPPGLPTCTAVAAHPERRWPESLTRTALYFICSCNVIIRCSFVQLPKLEYVWRKRMPRVKCALER